MYWQFRAHVYPRDCGLLITWYALQFIVLGYNSNGGTICCKWKGTLGMERFSLKRDIAEGVWGGFLYWGPCKIC
jgi:hypothetical protein